MSDKMENIVEDNSPDNHILIPCEINFDSFGKEQEIPMLSSSPVYQSHGITNPAYLNNDDLDDKDPISLNHISVSSHIEKERDNKEEEQDDQSLIRVPTLPPWDLVEDVEVEESES